MSDRNTPYKEGALIPLLIAAAVLIEAGKMVAAGADGYAVPAADTAGLVVLGVADETRDNSAGADGALSVTARRRRVFKLKNSATDPVTQASVGSDVLVEDAQTVCVAGTVVNAVVAGKCLGVAADGVWVEIG